MKPISTIIFAVLLLMSSCTENPIKVETQKLTLEDIKTSPSYSGFNFYFEGFHSKQTAISQISSSFNNGTHRFVFFLSPSCFSCGRIDSLSPRLVKILTDALIPTTSYEIYSMQNYKSEHPYIDKINLKILPEMWILKGGVPVYNVTEAIMEFVFANPTENINYEEFVLEGLNK